MGFFVKRKGVGGKMDNSSWLSIATCLLTIVAQALASEPRVVCYYTNWSVYRPGTAKFNPQNINPYLCTHLVYAFGGFTKDNTLKPFDQYQDIEKGGYAKFTGLKTYNKNLKTMLAIGGWNEGSARFSPLVASRERRKEFVRNAIKFLRQNRFDGLDLDWEYPAFRDGGKAKDRENYAKLVKELREEFERESEKTGRPRLLLTMAVPAGIEYIAKGFDIKTLNRYLDWMNLLSYDYHSAFEPAVNHHAPLYPIEEPNEYSVDNELNINYTIQYYIENGADRNKLVLGIPTYGRSYTLFNPEATEIGAPADGPGEQGDATREKGYLAYYEICESLKPKEKKVKRAIADESDEDSEEEEEEEEEEEDQEWTIIHPNSNAMGPVAYRGNQWVGYDDVDIVQKKAEYVADNGLGGIMFWSIDNDDFRGNCHGKPYPLIEAAKEAYISKVGSTDNVVVSERPKSSSSRRNRPRVTAKPSTTTRAPQSNKRKSSLSSTTPSWNVQTPEPPTTPDPGSDFKCTEEGFFQHPRDCKKYFWCLDSGPSNLGIVAHQFTCPSGLFFNKAADSCDFARNVLCKKGSTTTKSPITSKPTTARTTTTTNEPSTTKKPFVISTRNSLLFRTTTTTTTPEPIEEEEEISDEEVDTSDVDAEDPRVIKELIDLIKKVGGVEQLEKHLHLAETSMNTGSVGTTTPATFNKKLYQKVLERTRKNKFNAESAPEKSNLNSRRGPQNAGLERNPEATAARKDRPQYTTINRSRPSPSTTTEETVEAIVEEVQDSPRYIESREETGTKVGTTSKPLQYVNIRRARPSSQFSTDTADDTASRNALFERNEPIIPESQSSPNAINTKRESIPEYVTIRRQRPTTEETTTVQYDSAELSVEESLNSKRIENETVSSPSSASQPQYTSILRVRSTTVAAQTEESVNTPEPTTVLAVQLSSLLNNPVSTETEVPDEELTSAETTLTTEPSSTTSTTTVPSSRRPAFRRRGSTTSTTPVSTSSTTSQVSSEKAYTFVRRRPQLRPNEITPDLVGSSDIKTSRKIRSTTPDSREGLEIVKPQRESNQVQKRYRFRLEGNQEDAVPAAATTVSRGQFRPRLSRDELISLTPIDNEKFEESPRDNINQRVQRVERRFRPRVTTVTDQVEDSDVSAATVELRRPNILPRGRNKFIPSSTEAAPARNFEQTYRRPTISRFTPRPFTSPLPIESTPFTNRPDDDSLKEPSYTINNLQARKLPYLDEDEEKHDIDLSESSIEEKEHVEETETDVAPKRRIVIKKIRTSIGTTESTKLTTNLVSNEPEDSTNTDDVNKQKRVKIIRRRPTSTINPESNSPTSSPDFLSSTSVPPRIRKIIRKKLRTEPESQTKNYTYEPEILSKTTESLESLNYGDKSKPTTQTISTTTIETTTTTTTNTPIEISSTTEAVETDLDDSEDTLSSEKENSSEYIQDEKPLVIIQNKEEADISDNEDDQITTLESSKPPTEASTASSTLESSPTPRSRLPYRPPKRLFTSSTEPPLSFSSRTYSRKYNGRVYTTPATADKNSEQSRSTSSRRPLFSSRPFSRKPFTTARTTTKVEEDFDDEDYESQEDQSEEENFEVLPEEKFFTRKPYQDQNAKDDSQNDSALSSKKPTFRLKSINSNTFRTSALTTELPARHSTASVNISSILNRFSDKGNDSKKRVQNVPAGYSAPKAETITEKSKLITTESTDKEIDESTENSFENVTTTEDDYLTNFDVTTTDATSTDSNTDVTEKVNEVHTTQLSNFDIYADDYLEASDDTTINPEDIFATFDFSDEKSTTLSQDITTDERTAETTDEPELLTTTVKLSSASPVFETYFDKLFSIRRVEEVSSKLNKHRVNKNNESRLIESGEIMQEKKPTEVKIGEVSRYSLIKIVEGDIPIYLTKLGHVYPVENPPDNLIRIDEARNARSLLNFSEAGKENLIASESINKAYHTNNIASIPVESETSKEVEQSRNDDFLSFINEDKISDDSAENQSLWQFVPAAYENERSRQNKEAKSFEIITPRNVLTNPSTLPLEALFKTEIPVLQIARKVTLNENNSQPFVVYSSTLSEMKENDNPKKMENIRSELAHNIKTYVKGQELNGASSTEEADVMYPVYVSATTKETEAPLLTTTNAPPTSEATNSNSTKLLLSTIAEIEETTIAATTFATTTETILEDTTTQKLSLVDALSENAKKRPKFAFPRRPNFKTSNVTRPPLSTSPRTTKKLSTLSLATSPSRLNKTSGFNPTKSRFTSNRAQNVPIELRSSRKSNIVPSKNFTTEAPKQISTTERKPVFKPFRPNIRPAFVPRRSTTLPPTTQTTQGVKRQRPNFLRRSKTTPRPTEATESSDNDLTTEFSTIVENTTSKYTRRGQSRFRNRSEAKLDEARKRVNTTASAQKSDAGKSTRTAVRRRLSGTGATTTTTPIPSSSRRPFRVASRRRPFNKTITTTTASPTTTVAGSDEYLQDLDEKESIEEPDLKPRRAPLKKTVKVQRRPLTSLKEAELKLKDQNPSASSDDQGKRQSKKYSSSFKQNQLDEVIRQKTKSEEEMEDTTATTEDFSPETAVVIAAHQLLAAPLPSTSYDDDYTSTTSKKHISTKSTQKSTITNIDPYGYTTDGKLVYSNNPTGYTSTPSYATTSRSPSSLILQPSTEYIRSGVLSNSDGFSGVSQPQLGVSTARYLGTSDKYLSIPVEEFGYSTEGYIGGLSQEPVYFTREYLLESPVTRTYDDEYQYLSPVTTPSTTTRKIPKKTVHKRISTTQRPTTQSLPVHVSTVKPRRVPQKKAFDKILKEPKKIYKPIENYDYYDDSNEKIVNKYDEGTKVVVHGKGSIECLDIGNFPHPTSCKKFISCARMESGAIVGWEYVCPIGLSFDPVGGMCNWSAGLGCDEN